MGKKTKKTIWRTLPINTGECSDSTESSAHTTQYHYKSQNYHQSSKSYGNHTRPYQHINSKLNYSSQSTPIRGRFQNDNKSTRSSSTTSENKITFNEDEYTRITTPRQDVLFKKGYLSKPKIYQTQTSTGNSTVSTGNSTGNGTPDHQSADGTEGTDLEYEAQQFVFPNGFVDQNGIYYINSYDPYTPFMVYNAPFCYPDHHPTSRSKRYSTDSLTESTSPHNEETSQDLSQSGGETANNVDFNPAFNAAYPGLYCSGGGVPGSTEADNATTEPRKIKKKRRRKLSKPIPDGGTSSDEYSESEEPVSEIENRIIQGTHRTTTSTPEAKTDVHVAVDAKAAAAVAPTDEKPVDVSKTSLKPDAKEFVPRAYRVEHTHIPFIPPNFFFINELPPGFNPACLPPGIPINFIHPDQKAMNNFAIPNHPHHLQQLQLHPPAPKQLESTAEESKDFPQEETLPEVEKKPEEEPKPAPFPKRDIDIEVIVSKLEEAAKEQRRKLSPKFKPKPKRTYVKKTIEELPRDNEATSKMQYSDVSAKKSSAPLKDVKPNAMNIAVKTAVQQSPKRNPLPESPKAKPNPNQWISVSNKKKRKNKPQEVEDFSGQEEEEVVPVAEDGFESYDVSKLVDVVPIKPDNIIQVPEKVDVKPIPIPSVPQEIVIQDVQVIEKAMIEQSKKKPSENQEIDMLIESLAAMESKIKPKAVVAKQKKKVIVTDVDLSESVEEPKKAPSKIAKKVVVKKEIEEKPAAESPEKKKANKKKKKSPKDSQSVQNLDDYDFLIKDSLMVDEKTNVEVSEELDKIIQRGMYSSLEEKIRSLNITATNDGFFKTMSLLGPERKKSNDLTEALMKTTSFKPPVAPTREGVKVTSTELKTPSPPSSSTTTGSFLDLARDSSVVAADKEEKDETHPITQAVKDWMSRTRETTPDVEILKSPSEILQNFASDDVTLWTFSPQSSIDDDLLDCWEDDVTVIENNKAPIQTTADEALETLQPDTVKFEEIQGDNVDVEKKRPTSLPKHANLPFKAICCSLM